MKVSTIINVVLVIASLVLGGFYMAQWQNTKVILEGAGNRDEAWTIPRSELVDSKWESSELEPPLSPLRVRAIALEIATQLNSDRDKIKSHEWCVKRLMLNHVQLKDGDKWVYQLELEGLEYLPETKKPKKLAPQSGSGIQAFVPNVGGIQSHVDITLLVLMNGDTYVHAQHYSPEIVESLTKRKVKVCTEQFKSSRPVLGGGVF